MSRFWRRRELFSKRGSPGRYPQGRATGDKMIRNGEFPPPLRLSDGLDVWTDDVLDQYDREVAARHQAVVSKRRDDGAQP
jgi:predicted DNA-binding transcriptional regulator AlpA